MADVRPRHARSVFHRCGGGTDGGLVSKDMIESTNLLPRERHASRTDGGLVSKDVIDSTNLLARKRGLTDRDRRDLPRHRCLDAVDDEGYCGNANGRDREQRQEQNPPLRLLWSDRRTASMPVCGGHDYLPASCGWMIPGRILDRTDCRGVAGGLHPRCMLVPRGLEVGWRHADMRGRTILAGWVDGDPENSLPIDALSRKRRDADPSFPMMMLPARCVDLG